MSMNKDTTATDVVAAISALNGDYASATGPEQAQMLAFWKAMLGAQFTRLAADVEVLPDTLQVKTGISVTVSPVSGIGATTQAKAIENTGKIQ